LPVKEPSDRGRRACVHDRFNYKQRKLVSVQNLLYRAVPQLEHLLLIFANGNLVVARSIAVFNVGALKVEKR